MSSSVDPSAISHGAAASNMLGKIALPPVNVRPVEARDLAAILALHRRAFGPGRFVRAAHRVREGRADFSRWCLVAELNTVIVATLRMTPVTIGGADGALMLGPLAVEPVFAGQGIGRHLVAVSLEQAQADGQRLVLLVGDEPYYGKFGFKPVPPGQIDMPGPVNRRRLLAAELQPGAASGYRGMVAAAGAIDGEAGEALPRRLLVG